ncbi:MAG TPA: iron ABC transporter permease [Polyangia bacterium]
MPRRAIITYVVLLALLGAVPAAALLLGQADLSDASLKATLLELRAIRIGAAVVAGAALAVGGVVAQGLFRNPLVSPSILGTTTGAMLGGQIAILLFSALPGLRNLPGVGPAMVLPLGCLLGAEAALLVLLLFVRGRSDNVTLLLTGFILSSLFLALGGFVTSLAQDSWDLARAVVSFTLGGVSGVGWRQLLLVVPLIVVAIVVTWIWGPALDLLLSGEDEAQSLGVDVGPARRWLTVWIAVLTGAAVAVGGNVVFVGLIVPHVLRPFVGVNHRRLIPAAALAGGVFVLLCDLVARLLPTRSEVPLGVVTGIVGAPLFLWLLARTQRGVAVG